MKQLVEKDRLGYSTDEEEYRIQYTLPYRFRLILSEVDQIAENKMNMIESEGSRLWLNYFSDLFKCIAGTSLAYSAIRIKKPSMGT